MDMDIMNLAPPLPQSYFLLIQYCKFGIHNFIKQPSFTIITLSYHHNLWHNKYISKYQNSMDKNKIEQELGTEIQPIPKQIDPALYVAEYQLIEENSGERQQQESNASVAAAVAAMTKNS